MAVLKCKMCGGTIEFEDGAKIGTCDSCGTRQTLPNIDSDRRANLYDRGNHYRRNNEYDKAIGIYEQILNDDPNDAEAYWSLVLCRYGVEYIEDPMSHKRIPTINRTQFTSIFNDEDYRQALKCADASSRGLYEEEASRINEIQKGILEISQKEDPYDVFICYKETGTDGRRTQDSVIANDIYHQLTQEGYKVFFSRITLEDKIGSAYEPYIFAAINSAKVMIVLGTRAEFFNSVWVKNEWSRFLTVVKESGGKKLLIPAYKDMDPYDLPEEFAHLQAQDMSKIGFMQDLIRGIGKVVNEKKNPSIVETQGGEESVAPLLKRVYLFLEDGNWSEADAYCERVLDQDPENAEAYLGKLLAELHLKRKEELVESKQSFAENSNYQKILRFGSDDLVKTLSDYLESNNEKRRNENREAIYRRAVSAMKDSDDEATFKKAAELFQKVSGLRDADTLAVQCEQQAEMCRKDAVYEKAKALMEKGDNSGYFAAIQEFEKVYGWKDSSEQIKKCQNRIKELKEQREEEEAKRLEFEKEQEKTRKARKQRMWIIVDVVVILLAFVFIYLIITVPKSRTNKIAMLLDSGDYETVKSMLSDGKYLGASAKYELASDRIDSEDYEGAYILLSGLNYQDSEDVLKQIKPRYTQAVLSKAEVGSRVNFGEYEQSYYGKEEITWVVLAREDGRVLLISEYILDRQQYAFTDSQKWNNCYLRKWLNTDFYSSAFNTEEQEIIVDDVCVLTETQANNYLDSFYSSPTDYCDLKMHLEVESISYEDEDDWWIMKANGEDSAVADGHSQKISHPSSRKIEGVRPVIWVDLGE